MSSSITVDPNEYSASKIRMIRFMKIYSPVAPKDITGYMKLNKTTVYKHINKLLKDGFIKKKGIGHNVKYSLSSNFSYEVSMIKPFKKKHQTSS